MAQPSFQEDLLPCPPVLPAVVPVSPMAVNLLLIHYLECSPGLSVPAATSALSPVQALSLVCTCACVGEHVLYVNHGDECGLRLPVFLSLPTSSAALIKSPHFCVSVSSAVKWDINSHIIECQWKSRYCTWHLVRSAPLPPLVGVSPQHLSHRQP